MNEAMALERGYRRLVACYPRSFRQDNGDEILTVLMATARDGQQRPGIVESADLLRGAVRMRMGLSHSPRTVLNAARLMYLGALVEVSVLVTFALTAYSGRADFLLRNPHASAAQLQALDVHIVGNWISLPLAVVAWVWMAWTTGQGNDRARLVSVALFALNTMALIYALAQGLATYLPVSMALSGAAWVIGLVAIALLFCKPSWRYYEQPVAQR
jgi:hypothetical protein